MKKLPTFDPEKFIQEIELEYIEFLSSDLNKKKKSLPLMDRKSVYSLIWNLFANKKFIERISIANYYKLMDVLVERLKVIDNNENSS